jgi:zinc protease
LQLGGLPITYVDERNEMINAVTKEDIARVAERLLHPGELIVTVVGQPEGIEPAAATADDVVAE